MQIRKFSLLVVAALLVALLVGSTAIAQPGRGGAGFGGPGALDGNLLALARNPAAQRHLECLEEQVEQIRQLADELRPERGAERQDFRSMTEEERQAAFQQRREQAEQQAAIAKGKLAGILLPNQMERLEEIWLQQRGLRALSDEEIARKVGLTAQQVAKVTAQLEANQTLMRERMQEIMQSADREAAREQLGRLRTEGEGKVLAILNSAQQTTWKKMNGEPFDMPRPQFGDPRGQGEPQPQSGPGAGRGQRGGPGGGQAPQRGGQPRRPDAAGRPGGPNA